MTSRKNWCSLAAGLAVVIAVATACYQALPGQSQHGGPRGGVPPAVLSVRPANGGFGPEMEATVPGAGSRGRIEMLNLETGGWKAAPDLARFHNDVGALLTWIRNNGVNISSCACPDGSVGCVTYNLTAVPVATECWEEAAAQVIRHIPAQATSHYSPRRLLVLKPGKPEIYAFRTDTGTFGILRLVSSSDDGRGLKIRYKLVLERGDAVDPFAVN